MYLRGSSHVVTIFFRFFWKIYFVKLNEHTTANFSAHIYSYLEYFLKMLQSQILSHCLTIWQLSHLSLQKYLDAIYAKKKICSHHALRAQLASLASLSAPRARDLIVALRAPFFLDLALVLVLFTYIQIYSL